jgi:hypothetical protein
MDLMSESKPVVNVTESIARAHGLGRQYTDARNAMIAHALLTGVKAVTIVKETGVDKGDVSRISKAANALTLRQQKSIKSLVIPAANAVTSVTSDAMAALIKAGESHFRRVKATRSGSNGSTGSEVTPDGRVRDALAVIYDEIVKADDATVAGWRALIADVLQKADDERASAAAEKAAA